MKLSFFDRRRAHLEGYTIDADGHKLYNPVIYRFRGSKKERLRFNIAVTCWVILLVGLCIASGIPKSGDLWNQKYVVIPFVLEGIGLLALAITFIRYIFEEHPLPIRMYRSTVPVFKLLSVVFIIINIAELITAVIYIITSKPEETLAGCIIYAALKLISCVINIISGKILRDASWIREIKEVSEENSPEKLLLQ